jgi:hypothetical protein
VSSALEHASHETLETQLDRLAGFLRAAVLAHRRGLAQGRA